MAKHKPSRPRPTWNVERIAADMVARRWNALDLARASGVTAKTILRFLDGSTQTTKTAGKIADAFGFNIRRYCSRIEAA